MLSFPQGIRVPCFETVFLGCCGIMDALSAVCLQHHDLEGASLWAWHLEGSRQTVPDIGSRNERR